MPLVILALALVVLVALSLWSARRTRRRILGGSAEAAMPAGLTQTPEQAANELRAVIDAQNGRGAL